jgi:hypothetical protein
MKCILDGTIGNEKRRTLYAHALLVCSGQVHLKNGLPGWREC